MGKIIVGIIIVVGVVGFILMKNNNDTTVVVKGGAKTETVVQAGDVKEFSMTSYYDEKGKWFSLKEISVKKGDRVRIKVTNTKGTHDFNIDEYKIKEATPLNKEVVIEFTADKAGEFEYYCSMPGHRQAGQFGKLIVKE
ncbi:MAG: cupredoxin domain-containing protein [bacterium]|nr:cupredoxin domain-containing protein [bacterium]